MSEITPRGVRIYSVDETLKRQFFIGKITRTLELAGYQPVEVPSLVKTEMFASCTVVGSTHTKKLVVGQDLVTLVTGFISTRQK